LVTATLFEAEINVSAWLGDFNTYFTAM